MAIRDDLSTAMKTAMKSGDTARLSTIRMILSRLKDTDIAARPKGVEKIADDEVLAMMRSMIKPRREAIELYEKGNRPELAAKEEAEITVIEGFLPKSLDDAQMKAASEAAVASTGATGPKDMGRVMAALKAEHGAALDMSRIGAFVKAALAG
ncbi:GatB/YqeY domain-containing protein [Acidisoma cladoniae]|jgi:uncharacterized protein YqeY|uniref:GatB/YqeY domain-containing protein n=1 Tax=Acidisoma cladoniae TaxID=3040935 RepID=UPI00254C9629|nr:GatB/YqeY domain-containing protein [Acidisoma sp. PAMC 29798]